MSYECLSIAAGVDVIQTSFGERPLSLGIIHGQEAALIDTGMAGTPGEVIIPCLASRGLAPRDLDLAIVTHAHADHFAGNEAMRQASGDQLRFAAHRLDKAFIEDPAGHTRLSNRPYVDLGLMTTDDLEGEVAACGTGVRLGRVLAGGEVFPLGGDLDLEMVHLPGHTAGNIAVLERKHGILFQGETIIGTAQFNVRGELLTCPHHMDTAAYLETVAAVARLDFQTMVPSHFPLMDRRQAAHFMQESLDFVLDFEAEVRRRLQAAMQPVTALEMWQSLGRLWARYPHDLALYMLLESHLNGLVKRGQAEGSLLAGIRWLGSTRDDLGDLTDQARRAIHAM